MLCVADRGCCGFEFWNRAQAKGAELLWRVNAKLGLPREDELKTHLRGRQMLLRSKTPDLIRQEFYGLMMAHFAIRGVRRKWVLKRVDWV
jgi:hypothetical protein